MPIDHEPEWEDSDWITGAHIEPLTPVEAQQEDAAAAQLMHEVSAGSTPEQQARITELDAAGGFAVDSLETPKERLRRYEDLFGDIDQHVVIENLTGHVDRTDISIADRASALMKDSQGND